MTIIKRISASSVNTYDACPLQWYFNYALGLLQLPNPAFIIGTTYHQALEQFHSGVKIESVIQNVKKVLEQDIEAVFVTRKMIEKYVKAPVPGNVVSTEYQFSVQVPFIDIPLFGYIDRIDEDKIVEYKTSSFDYLLDDVKTIQSKIYAYVIYREKGKMLPVTYSINNKKKINNDDYVPQTLSITYNKQDMLDLEKELLEFYNKVKERKFEHKKGVHCRWCPWSKKQLDICKYSI